MTNWLPDLSAGAGPLYQRLAERIELDIDTGALPAGSKLPPQRDLAFDIGTTVGTVGRAYSLLRERGLVSGEVGRGTYILQRHEERPAQSAVAVQDGTRLLEAPSDKIRFDTTAAPDVGQSAAVSEIVTAVTRELPTEVASYTRTFPRHWFEAGSRWLARGTFRPSPDSIVPTIGVHAAVMAVIAALTNAGDYIAVEHVSYAQVARSAGLLGRRIALINSDQHGMDPSDFQSVCAQKHPKLAFLMPTAQNPTCVTMPADRRQAIARIAREYNVLLVEDDLYGHQSDDSTPLLAEFAPERTFVAGGLSKSVTAGMRGGWIACPPEHRHRLRVAHKMMTGGVPFLLAEASARLVLSGLAADIRRKSIAEINARLAFVHSAFAGFTYGSVPGIPFVWLALPEPWNSGTFKNAAYERGVLVDDEDEYKAGRSDKVFHRARIGVSVPERATVQQGLAVIQRLLNEGGVGYANFD